MTHPRLPVAVLISGRGSNLARLIAAAESYEVVGVLSDLPDAPGLEHARRTRIPFVTVDRRSFASRAEQKTAILAAVRAMNPEVVALAGFMQLIAPAFLEAFPHRVVNIHPSLLPDFPGLDTHQRVLDAGIRNHGCTVHLVDSGVDTGPRLAQAELAVRLGTTQAELAAEVLALEHALYPWVMNVWGRGELAVTGGRVEWSPIATADARTRGFTLF